MHEKLSIALLLHLTDNKLCATRRGKKFEKHMIPRIIGVSGKPHLFKKLHEENWQKVSSDKTEVKKE